MARQYLEPIPSQAPPLPVTTAEPEQLGERRIQVNKFAQLPILQVTYHSPAAEDPDFIPLDVLEYILLRGQSSRLYQRLVDKEQVANSVRGGQSPHLDPFLFEITVQPRSGVAVERVETILYEELGKVQANLVAEQELQKAKNTAIADFYRSMKTINGKANVLGTYDVVFGDYRKLFSAVDLINQVSREEVERVRGDLKDLKQFVETGTSMKYAGEKILGRWGFNVAATMTLVKKARPNLGPVEVSRLRKTLLARMSRAMLTATLDNRIILKTGGVTVPLEVAAKGAWKKIGDEQYQLTLDKAGQTLNPSARIEGNKISFPGDGDSPWAFEKEL